MFTIISIVDFSCRYKKFIPIFVVLIIHGLTMEKIKNLWFDIALLCMLSAKS